MPRVRRTKARRPGVHGGWVVVLLVLSGTIIAVAPSALPASYSWVAHTTSEAAAQGVPGASVARLGFLAFGFAVLVLIPLRKPSWGRVAASLHAAFGVLMISAAAFSSRSWEVTASFDRMEDLLHSVAATGMGFAFALGVAVSAWNRFGRRVRPRDAAAVVASVALPLSMAASQSHTGLLQRAMFVVAYYWYAMEALAGSAAPDQPQGSLMVQTSGGARHLA